jgi:PAS domain S-box-containing protein
LIRAARSPEDGAVGDDRRAKTREELDASELRDTLDLLREGIQILSPDWRYVYVNDAVAAHGRRARYELLGRTMFECYPGIERTAMFSVLQTCMRERRTEHIENEFAYDSGQRAWFELRIQPCTEGLIVLSLDITERKRLEASVRQDDKLRALGQMAAGIAHDLKNILNPIALQLQLLRSHVGGAGGGAGDTFDALATIEEAIRAGSDTVESLRRFSRKDADRTPEPGDVNRYADLALEICRPKVREHPGLAVVRERQEAPEVLVRGSEMVTAIVNLLVNAVDALPSSGRIVLRTGAGPSERGAGDVVAARGAWIEVADDGPGMPPEVESRMFEPFFTTKPQGTGLGLSMVYAFVRRHGGRITVETADGRGTVVRMWFPAAPAPELAHERALLARPAPRLLLVEDEPASRRALQLLLEDEGFTVEARSTGEEALAALPGYDPDALVVDFRLPGIDGVRLARTLRESRGALPVVIMSGHDRTNTALAAFLRSPHTEHVSKPIDVAVLVDTLNRLVDGGAHGIPLG